MNIHYKIQTLKDAQNILKDVQDACFPHKHNEYARILKGIQTEIDLLKEQI